MSLTNKGNNEMKNKKIDAVATLGQGYHIHSHNCGDIKRSSMYRVTNKFKLTLDILESPFEEYSDLEFTILEKQTRCGANGNAYMELATGDPIEMIAPNVYVLDVPKDEEDEHYEYAYDENGNQKRYTLKQISEISCFGTWEDPKIFPCAKK